MTSGVRAPIVGDFHYNGHLLLKEYPACAALDKYRINPGNVGAGAQHDDNFRKMIEVAVAHGKPVRIGVNWARSDRALLTAMMDEKREARAPASRPRSRARGAARERDALGRALAESFWPAARQGSCCRPR